MSDRFRFLRVTLDDTTNRILEKHTHGFVIDPRMCDGCVRRQNAIEEQRRELQRNLPLIVEALTAAEERDLAQMTATQRGNALAYADDQLAAAKADLATLQSSLELYKVQQDLLREEIAGLKAAIDLAHGHLGLAEKYMSDPTGRTFHVFAAREALEELRGSEGMRSTSSGSPGSGQSPSADASTTLHPSRPCDPAC